ncbi:Pyrimidine dimer DNA glycosylase [uncultured archaeon]|nr:Pyrimidine dimer DNA glycosylase [uncultured archaeon]
MVRINLVNPKFLTDQHLVAEYDEILMLVNHTKKYPKPKKEVKAYKLGKGHINFFKNKMKYLKERHELIKKEMIRRGFKTRKSVSFSGLDKKQLKNWEPKDPDLKLIKRRLIQKINKKPTWYRYYGENIGKKKLLEITKNAK